MRAKTIFIIVLSVLITIVIMQNSDEVWFSLFFWNVSVSKLVVMASIALISFLIGFLSGRKKQKPVEAAADYQDTPVKNQDSGLSEEDRNYIS